MVLVVLDNIIMNGVNFKFRQRYLLNNHEASPAQYKDFKGTVKLTSPGTDSYSSRVLILMKVKVKVQRHPL